MKSATCTLLIFFASCIRAQMLQVDFSPNGFENFDFNKAFASGFTKIERLDSGTCGNPFFMHYKEVATLDKKGRISKYQVYFGEKLECEAKYFYSSKPGPDSITYNPALIRTKETFKYDAKGHVIFHGMYIQAKNATHEKREIEFAFDSLGRKITQKESYLLRPWLEDKKKYQEWKLLHTNSMDFFYSGSDTVPGRIESKFSSEENGDTDHRNIFLAYDEKDRVVHEIVASLHANPAADQYWMDTLRSWTNYTDSIHQSVSWSENESGVRFNYAIRHYDSLGRVDRVQFESSGYPVGNYWKVTETQWMDNGLPTSEFSFQVDLENYSTLPQEKKPNYSELTRMALSAKPCEWVTFQYIR